MEYWDKEKSTMIVIERQIWNATVANLTLMALGSSAPEILLSVISTLKDIRAVPPELGPSTIVGSAAFNLLVISGVSIIAVGGEDGEIKKIDDVWVFGVTAILSVWAYIWMYICIEDNKVNVTEGVMTCVFFVALIVISYTADRVNSYRVQQRRTQEERDEADRDEEIKLKKDQIRRIGREFSDNAVIEVAQGINSNNTAQISEQTKKEIRDLFCQIHQVDKVSEIAVNDLLESMQPETLLERFAYRKRNAGNAGDFIRIKGAKGQLEHDEQAKKLVNDVNEYVGFKCLHYSVTESNGHVEITIAKKIISQEITIGVRTINDTAQAPRDYTHIDEIIEFGKRDTEKKIRIPIVDDEEWNPDLEFIVELYDPNKLEGEDRLPGDDTRCRVTILDEDFPGTIGF